MDEGTQTILKENGKLSLDEMTDKRKNYLDAHPVDFNVNQNGKRKAFKEKFHNKTEFKPSN